MALSINIIKPTIRLLFVGLGIIATVCASTPETRIINGDRVGANEADFYVALISKYNYGTGRTYNPFCGATHVGDGKIVTAAHCLDSMTGFTEFYLLFGDTSEEMHLEYCYIDSSSPDYDCVSDKDGVPDLAI